MLRENEQRARTEDTAMKQAVARTEDTAMKQAVVRTEDAGMTYLHHKYTA